MESAWVRVLKVHGKFGGKGLGMRAWKVRGYVGVESAWKVAGVRGFAKLMERLRRGIVMCLEMSWVWLEGAWVTVLWVCDLGFYMA